MDDGIEELQICNVEGSTIFSQSDVKYVVPLYQRAYSWGDEEIEQMIDDINGIDENSEDIYYLGSLIVSKRNDNFEVIDGQQRLTTLLLLLVFLKGSGINLIINNILSYDCRKKSDSTFSKLFRDGIKLFKDDIQPDEDCERNLLNGAKIIGDKFASESIDVQNFVSKLSHVKLFRIPVPVKTDLNLYFEIMNTRGEQLEQHDILKAKLMSYIEDEDDKTSFAKIWDACSDMTGYVQMHFDVNARKSIFGYFWSKMPDNPLGALGESSDKDAPVDIDAILASDFSVISQDGFDEEYKKVRFESIIEFPYLLLHVLKAFTAREGITLSEGKSLREQLDDKQLVGEFMKVIEHGERDGASIHGQEEDFVLEFIVALLKCRYLFDKFIIKREFVENSNDSKWSLKELGASGKKENRTSQYTNTRIAKPKQQTKTSEVRRKNALMLQSALRVSYTSPKDMHWITRLLTWTYTNDVSSDPDAFCALAESIAQEPIREYLKLSTQNRNSLGVATPRIVFNYLDYLLWRDSQNSYENFVFEFRNSVEHWYPQHPSEGTFETWPTEKLNDFGNLCIVQRNINSHFSNLSPFSKKDTFKDMISEGSIKLRVMSELTNNEYGDWEKKYKDHGEKMLNRLRNACGVWD